MSLISELAEAGNQISSEASLASIVSSKTAKDTRLSQT